jgi:glycosyltransferase involved in cell wall biosynthesis
LCIPLSEVMKILLPISLDRWRNPISTLQRACVRYNPDIEFHSFSNPVSDEDRAEGESFWKLPNLHMRKPVDILKDRFDIVHTASYSHGNYVSSVLAKLRGMGGTRFLNTMNLEQHPSHPACWARYHRLIRWVDGFVAVSEAVAADIRQRVPKLFLGVIPNGFDPDYFDPSIVDEDALPERIRTLGPHRYTLTVSAIEARKRPDVLIALAKRRPEVPMVLAGAVMPGAEDLAAELESLPNLIWLKGVDRRVIRALLKHAGVFLFPSDREGLPLAMIESLGMGLPVVAQPRSSMPELVTDGFNGRLVDAADHDGWEAAMNEYLNLPSSSRSLLTGNIRAEVKERFAWPEIGAAYGPVYRKMVRG